MPHPNSEHLRGAPSATKGEDPRVLSTNSGAPIDNLLYSMTVGERGPALFEDSVLFENIQIHNRERIPERIVHARGTAAKGSLTITDPIPELTTAGFLQTAGTVCPIAVRFSMVIHGNHSPEFLRDVRGFALKIYTGEGNYDIVCNDTPVFFNRDGMRFPDLVRALKPNPKTNMQEWWRILDHLSHFPESVNGLSYLTDDIGQPASYRQINGFSINTFKFISREGRTTLFRWHFQSHLGEKGMRDEDMLGRHFSFHSIDLMSAIERGEHPRWNLMFQAIDDTNMPDDFDPLDATKDWPEPRFPFRKVGEFVLDQNVESTFMENECLAFSPSRLVPGIAPSEDKLLAARLFAYVDTQRYRLGTNNQMLPINAPKCPFVDNHVDGMMNFRLDTRGMREANYFPSRTTKFVHATGIPANPTVIQEAPRVRDDLPPQDEFKQPGERLRALTEERRKRFVERWANILTSTRVTKEVRDIWVSNWTRADEKIGKAIQRYLDVLAKDPGTLSEEENQIVKEVSYRKRAMILTGPSFD